MYLGPKSVASFGRLAVAMALVASALVATESANAATASPPYAPVPPTGITCRAAAGKPINYVCVIGYSVDMRPIYAERQGNPDSARVLLVNGQMHGEEWPGEMVVDYLRTLPTSASADYQIWTIKTINPDGARIGRRWNSHGVDLNANFPNKFKVMRRTGAHALTEPEAISMARFLTWLQPDLVISLHGFNTSTDTTGGGKRAGWAQRFAKLTHITPVHPVSCDGPCHGNMTDWYSATSKVQGVAFTVEMPRSSKSARACSVPGRPARAATVYCTAWTALHLAAQLPD
jgi:predicted deacylase